MRMDGQETELDKVLDEVVKSKDTKALEVFIQRNVCNRTPVKCSQHFLHKLDKLVQRSLDQKDSKSASLGLSILYKCGKDLKPPGGDHWLSGLISHGLLKKMAQWFEKCRQLWIQSGPQWNELKLSEDFFDVLMVAHEAGKDGAYEFTECFLLPVGQLVVDPRIYILIQKEAINKFNLILGKIPPKLKTENKILTSLEASDIMDKLAALVLDGGDYDLQIAAIEALCRMSSPVQRKQLVNCWFSMAYVASAFVKIRSTDFETDCRKFLNMVNGMHGDKRRVHSFPCLEVYLDKHELLMPVCEELEEFWIDFNLGSHSISFYFSLAGKEAQEEYWETLCINENEVQCYTVKAQEEGKRQVLQLMLSHMVVVGPVEGSMLTIYFSASLDILQAARRVYGHKKNGFVGKTCLSKTKTAVKVVMEGNSSQVVVPESPLSLDETEKNTAPYCLPTPSAPPMETPARRKFSESNTIISSSSGGSLSGARSFSVVMPSNTLAKRKGTPSLEMVLSCNRQRQILPGNQRTTDEAHSRTTSNSTEAVGIRDQSTASIQPIKNKAKLLQNIPLAKAVDMVLTGHGKEQSQEEDVVPDTQPGAKSSISSEWKKMSISEILMMPTQKITSVSKPELRLSSEKQKTAVERLSLTHSGPISQKQLHSSLTERLQEVVNEKNQDAAGKGKSSTLGASKDQKAQKNRLGREKSKGLLSLEARGVDVDAPIKTSTKKNPQETTPNVTFTKRRACSSKAKSGVEATDNMMKVISSHDNTKGKSEAKENVPPQSWIPSLVNRPVFNMSWLSTAKKQVSWTAGARSSPKKPAANFERERDVFAFTTDTPSSIGGKGKHNTNTSGLSSSVTHDSTAPITTAKSTGQSAAKGKRHVKKHLFSDTDTDSIKTDISWLRESSRKPRPKMTQYSKQAPVKAKEAHISKESPDLPLLSAKPRKQPRPKKKRQDTKKVVGQRKKTAEAAAEPDRPHAAGRRPRRAAAAAAKSYREMDTDESLSEVEKSFVTKNFSDLQTESEKTCSKGPVVKKKNTSSFDQAAASNWRSGNNNNKSDLKILSSLKKPQNVPETTKLNKTKAVSTQEQKSALRGPWAARQASLSPFPPFIERMRSAERSAPTLDVTYSPLLPLWGSSLPASPDPHRQNTPSPVMLRPKPHSIVSSKGGFKPSSFRSTNKKKLSKSPSIPSFPSFSSPTSIGHLTNLSPPIGPSAAESSPVQQSLFSAPPSTLSPSFHPWLTSTLMEQEKLPIPSPYQSPSRNAAAVLVRHGRFSNVSSVSQISLSKSGTKSSPSISGNEESAIAELAVSPKIERTPFSNRALKPVHPHVSGPSRKRCISVSSDSEEDDRKKRKLRGNQNLKPRKLLESRKVTEVFAKREMRQITMMSSSPMETSGHWKDDGDLDTDDDMGLTDVYVDLNLCQLFSFELKKKFQNHHMLMESFKEQSVRILHQNTNSLSIQVTKHRTQKSDKIKKSLLDETRNMQHDGIVLDNMEKDLSALWKKQRVSFHCYFEQHSKRNKILKKIIHGNVSSILEYEEKIFTSQKCLVKKDLMSVQDKLLIEMHDGEIQSVKRGLQTLFSPDGGRI